MPWHKGISSCICSSINLVRLNMIYAPITPKVLIFYLVGFMWFVGKSEAAFSFYCNKQRYFVVLFAVAVAAE